MKTTTVVKNPRIISRVFSWFGRAIILFSLVLLRSAEEAPAATVYTINVPSTVPWTDTGINIAAGSQLGITASGTVHYSYSTYQVTDANGGDYTGQQFLSDMMLSNTVCHSLIGKIGGTTNIGTGTLVPEGTPGSGPGFVGTSYSEVISNSGELFLGFNDDVAVYWDNSGYFTVTCTVVPEPAAVIYWTQWTGATNGAPGSAGGTISALGVDVGYSGEMQSLFPNYPSWGPATTFSGGSVSNPPPSSFGSIQLSGGNPGVNTITFSKPVVDPVMAIWSLGDPSTTASFVFQTTQPITIESGGPSSEYSFGTSITQVSNTIYGAEGNGTIRFHGTFTQISWTDPTYEYYYAFTVGAPGVLASNPATNCVSSPSGLVSWWRAEGNALDSVGNNNGSLNGAVSYTSGEVGQAFNFDGASWVQVPDSPDLHFTNAMTVEAWVNLRTFSGANSREIVSKFGGPNLNQNSYTFSIDPGRQQAYFIVNNPNGVYAVVYSSTTILTNQWTHLAGVCDGSTIKIYVNGQLEGTTPWTQGIFPGTNPLVIGCTLQNFSFPTSFFNGLIDEVSLYNRALTQSEIQAICNAGSSGKCVPAPGVPVITSFSPQSGAAGTVVNLSGFSFDPTPSNNIVYFGAVRAVVTAASTTNLTVTVPVGATFAPITVTVNGLTAWAKAPFLPTYLGSGTINSSSLAPRVDLPAGDGPSQIAIGDLDGDGKPDLVVANSYDQTVWVYRNISTNGTLAAASFAPPVVLPLVGSGITPWPYWSVYVVLADLVGDGRLDIVACNGFYNSVSVFKNLCSPGSITTNSFGSRVDFSVAGAPSDIGVMDLDGDGKPDIITCNYSNNTVAVLQNIGVTGTITTNSFAAPVYFPVGPNPNQMAIADLDGDGKPDIVTANSPPFTLDTNNAVSVLRNTGTPGNISFASTVNLSGVPTSCNLAIGDLDGDGKLDLVVSSFINGQAVSVYRNVSTPGSITTNSFAPHVDFAVGGWGNDVAIGDLDGDGKPDLAVVTQLPDHLSLFKNISAPGSFATNSLAPRVDFSAGYNPNGVAIGDLDGDGRPDIVFANTYDNTISIYRNVVSVLGGCQPTILSQPQSLDVCDGSQASFSVSVSGSPPLYFQWQKNGTNLSDGGNISGSATTNLLLSPVTANDAGNYTVIASNACGSVTSSNATLKVLVPLTILSQPQSLAVSDGSPASFSVSVSGTPPLYFQWQRNGTNLTDGGNISGSTTTNLLLSTATANDAGGYRGILSNASGSVTSTVATLTVTVARPITFHTLAYGVGVYQDKNRAGKPVYALQPLAGHDLVAAALGQPLGTVLTNQILALEIDCVSTTASLVVFDQVTTRTIATIATSTSLDVVRQQDVHTTPFPNQERFVAQFAVTPTHNLVGGFLTVAGRLQLDPTTGCPQASRLRGDRLDHIFGGADVGNLDDRRDHDILRAGVGHAVGVLDLVFKGGTTNTVLLPDLRLSFRRSLD